MNVDDKIKQAKSILKRKRSIEDELYDMFTIKQLCTILDIPHGTGWQNRVGISKTKLVRALVLKWEVEDNEL
mgnify:CR=1 FL=1|tara:strand:+ start:8713 stop:8928 length:216 start_codon:yes stop_codon:yes gene_type:complete